jgi:hypothetical protein
VFAERVWSVGGIIPTGENKSTKTNILAQCHLLLHEFHMNWARIEPWPP